MIAIIKTICLVSRQHKANTKDNIQYIIFVVFMEPPTWKGAYCPHCVNPLSPRLFNHAWGVPDPSSTDLYQKVVSDFCADTSPDVFEVAGCAVCGK